MPILPWNIVEFAGVSYNIAVSTRPLSSAFALPDDFLLGTATSGLQVEGGDWPNSWTEWAEQGHVNDGSTPRNANDHWNRVEEDTKILIELGVHTHRLGIEWARIEPEPGRISQEALDHYRYEIELLVRAGIVPLVTLHHFTNPIWIEHDGSWLNPRTATRFARYVARVVSELKDLVTDWVTINEPNVYLYEGYVLGDWPPGHRSIREYLKGGRVMARAHKMAYHEIHRLCGSAARVGVAHHIRRFEPVQGIASSVVCRLWDGMFHRRFVRSMSRYSDFLGINYYTRDLIRASFKPSELFGTRVVPSGAEINDLGWEIHPVGLYEVACTLHRRCRLPVYITENGTCDRDDRFRTRFIYDHLRQVQRLIADDVPVLRYYHWTLIDNFEWSLGESAPFGLYHNDYTNQRRTARRSGEFYARVCRNRGITDEVIAQFADVL